MSSAQVYFLAFVPVKLQTALLLALATYLCLPDLLLVSLSEMVLLLCSDSLPDTVGTK